MPIKKKVFTIHSGAGPGLKVTAVPGAGPLGLMYLTIQGADGVATVSIAYDGEVPDTGDIWIDVRVSDTPGKKPGFGWRTRFARGAGRGTETVRT